MWVGSIKSVEGLERKRKKADPPMRKREFLLPDCLQSETSLFSHFGLEVKHWFFLGLKPTDLWTSSVPLALLFLRPLDLDYTDTVSSPGSPECLANCRSWDLSASIIK